ncbi:hypothetical protein Lsed01_00866 [Demequina sediminis]|uniref:Uncharacterized protein n=1 Tax=Demequina sediminis TaxID=1930058 RepID=A0ABP9WF27_9MICO|nr:hypothetical protein [Demequina sediminis]BDZ62480.1 hypothetical protein GCM10025873_22710 [Demequina sediminis]
MTTTLTAPDYTTTSLITQSTVIERGWTKAAIDRFLGDCDVERANPHYRSAAPMRLYYEGRVEAAESTEAFQEWKQKLEARRANPNRKVTGAAKAAQERKQREQDRLNALVEEFRALSTQEGFVDRFTSLREIHAEAVEHYNDHQFAVAMSRGWEVPTPVTRKNIQDADFLSRISMNFLRHVCTPYDEFVEQVGRNEWRDEYASRLQEIANDAIRARYAGV